MDLIQRLFLVGPPVIRSTPMNSTMKEKRKERQSKRKGGKRKKVENVLSTSSVFFLRPISFFFLFFPFLYSIFLFSPNQRLRHAKEGLKRHLHIYIQGKYGGKRETEAKTGKLENQRSHLVSGIFILIGR